MRGRYVSLDVLTAEHESVLYPIAVRCEMPWQWSGMAPTCDGFHQSLWGRALLNLAIRSNAGGEFLGFVGAYGANFHHGTAFFQVMVHPQARGTGMAVEGVELFLAHIFDRYPIRKLYAEVTDHSLSQFASVLHCTPFANEATMIEYVWARGAHRDVHMLALTKEHFGDFIRERSDRRMILGQKLRERTRGRN